MASPYNVGSYIAGAKAALNRWGHSDIDVYHTLRALGLRECEIAHIAKKERQEEKDGKETERNT